MKNMLVAGSVLAMGGALLLLAYTDPTPDPQPVQDSYPPHVYVMPEDIGRLESEVYKVCKQYANLDLSGMVTMCEMVGYQE